MAIMFGGDRVLQSGGISPTGGTFTGAVLFAAGTESAPGIAFSSDSNSGWYWTTSGSALFSSDGVTKALVGNVGAGIFGVYASTSFVTANSSVAAASDGGGWNTRLGNDRLELGKSRPISWNNGTFGQLNGSLTLSLYYAADGIVTIGTGGTSGNGNLRINGSVLTAGTMTATNSSEVRTTIHRYDWTNAMVVALGAVGAADMTVCTLPAKTVVKNAYIVIQTAATQAGTLTVSLGTTAGAPTEYLGAGDAKAAANTIYGNAAGERGAQVAIDFPSNTATTAVLARFASSGNLDLVTASTGTVYLETYTLP